VDIFIDAFMICERKLSLEKTFIMKKDDSALLPDGVKTLLAGLGWSCDGAIDLDASIVGVDA